MRLPPRRRETLHISILVARHGQSDEGSDSEHNGRPDRLAGNRNSPKHTVKGNVRTRRRGTSTLVECHGRRAVSLFGEMFDISFSHGHAGWTEVSFRNLAEQW